MLDRFNAFIEEHGLCRRNDRILLAVSGGMDSVALVQLFSGSAYDCVIAHCNFQLRGNESEAEEAFVRSLAAAVDMPVYINRFETEEWASEKRASIQMAARDLRYRWFGQLAESEGLARIATAHHLNDSVETFLLNLARGTGIRGLLGIPVRNGNVIRPLLFATRDEIERYIRTHGFSYREDSSNQDTGYTRNKIRHRVVGAMQEVNPAFIRVMEQNMGRLREISHVFRSAVENKRKELFRDKGTHTEIPLEMLRKLGPQRTWVYELFSPYGFTRPQCSTIIRIMDAPPGRHAHSGTHQLHKDRDRLILTAHGDTPGFERYYIDGPDKRSALPFPLDMEVMDRQSLGDIPGDPATACLDYEKIRFPLTIRHWLHGDYFHPLGMDRSKKVSDFFVDAKIPLPEKQRIWLLASGREIIWIMGHRIDHRFRITEKTRKVLLLRIHADIAPEHFEE